MKFLKNPCNIYITLWCLYNLQGALYPQGGWLSRTILLVLLLWSIYYFVVTITTFKLPVFLKLLTGLVFIFALYGLIPIVTGSDYGEIHRFEYLKQILISLLPIYAFYYYTKKGLLTEVSLRTWAIVFFFVAVSIFYYDQTTRLELTTAEGVTSKKSYVVLSLIPLIPLFYKKPALQYIMMGVITLFLLMGVKRGALLTGVLAETWLLVNIIFINKSNNINLKGLILTVALVFATVYAVDYFISTNDYFNYRVEQTLEGDSSDRDVIYSNALDVLFHGDSAFNFLFGHGAFGTRKTLGIYAHSDWLEIGINNGILVLLLYSLYWFQFFRYSRKSRHNVIVHQIIALFFITYFVKSFFSMSYSTYTIFSTSVLGFAICCMESKRDIQS